MHVRTATPKLMLPLSLLLLTAALLDPCAAQSVLHNVRFKVHIVMENELLRRDNTSSCGEEPSSGAGTFAGACRSHLELGHLPAHAPYSGHLINVWNELRDRGGFEYEISEEYDLNSYTAAYTAVTTSQEPNTITLGMHWLHPARVGSVSSINLDTYGPGISHGYRLRTWRKLDSTIDHFFVLLRPISTDLWAALVVVVVVTACFFNRVDQVGAAIDNGGRNRNAGSAAPESDASFTKRAARKAQATVKGASDGAGYASYMTLLVFCGRGHYESTTPSARVLDVALSIVALSASAALDPATSGWSPLLVPLP